MGWAAATALVVGYSRRIHIQLSGRLTSTPMYKAFYNLKRNPFEIIPDPSFLFSTPRHNEALAALYHGVTGT